MTASNAKTGEDKIVKPIRSIHIVVLSCPNCGEELEELKLCKECKSPMKVVQVIEKFGAEADEYLAQLKRDGLWEDHSVSPMKSNVISDDGISPDDIDDYDIPINGISKKKEDSDEFGELGLTDIFPSDDEFATTDKPQTDLDLKEALDLLDQDEEDDVPEGLPEL